MTDHIRRKVVLLHSNDIHSRLENAARIAGYIAEERRTYGSERVLAVDCGDHMDRMRVETEGSDGIVNVELLNAAGYEVATIGNNEGLTFSFQTIGETYADRVKFPIVCANMKIAATGERPEWLQASTIIVKNGIRIGFIGATAPFASFYKLLGWEVTEPFAAIAGEVKRLKNEVDVVIVLSHLGIVSDQQMAEQITGIDLILGAHTHHLLEQPLLIKETTICAAGKFGEYIGRVEIDMDEQTGRPIFSGTCIPTAAMPEQNEAETIISSFLESGKHRLSKVIARLAEPLPADTEREAPLGNLLAAGLRRWTDAEIGMVNAGQLLGGLIPGEVTTGDLHALCPSPINPCRMQLAGVQIREALEQSLLPEFISKPIKGFGFRGEVLGRLAVDGMNIEYDLTKPPMQRIINIALNGEPFDDTRVYSVGTIDMFSFKVGYETMANASACEFYLPEFIRDVIAYELSDEAALQDCRRERWQLLTGPFT